MTIPRLWPNNMMELRDEAAELADEAVKALGPFLNPAHPPEMEETRRAAIALEDCLEIMRLMGCAGSETVLQGINPNPAKFSFSAVSAR